MAGAEPPWKVWGQEWKQRHPFGNYRSCQLRDQSSFVEAGSNRCRKMRETLHAFRGRTSRFFQRET